MSPHDVKPSRDGIAQAWFREQARQASIACGLEQPVTWDACTPEDHERMLNSADAVLALLPGKTEQEVRIDERQKVAMEVRKSANLLHPDAVENGAVTIDSLIGFINDLAARIDALGVDL